MDDEFFSTSPEERLDHEVRKIISTREHFTEAEDNDMKEYIARNEAGALVRGCGLWIVMEKQGVCSGRRTWQAMRHRYLTKCLN
jgi:hypothetical protein